MPLLRKHNAVIRKSLQAIQDTLPAKHFRTKIAVPQNGRPESMPEVGLD